MLSLSDSVLNSTSAYFGVHVHAFMSLSSCDRLSLGTQRMILFCPAFSQTMTLLKVLGQAFVRDLISIY